jgi:hypothetical protein
VNKIKCEKCKHLYGHGVPVGEDEPRLLHTKDEAYSARSRMSLHPGEMTLFRYCPLCGDLLEILC